MYTYPFILIKNNTAKPCQENFFLLMEPGIFDFGIILVVKEGKGKVYYYC